MQNTDKKKIQAALIFIWFLFLMFAIKTSSSPLTIPQLPTDEDELVTLLEENIIDSLQYEELLNLYALQLSVPQGEYMYLVRIFPQIEELLPPLDILEEYAPFDNRSIRRLLNDFPVLADFYPVLRFNIAEARTATGGEIIFGINRSSINELSGHSARFRLRDPRFSLDGNVAFRDSGALWRTRRAVVPIGKWVGGGSGNNVSAVQIGNFAQPFDGELLYGRFTPLANNDENVIRDNWLYGGTNTWNGVSVRIHQIPRADMLGLRTFYHVRGFEEGGGAAIDYRINRQTRMSAAVTGFTDPASILLIREIDVSDNEDDDDIDNDNDFDINDTRDIAKEKNYATHVFLDYRRAEWRTNFEAALPLDGTTFPALSWRLSYRVRGSSAEYHLLRYPQNFYAPMSRVKRRLLSEIGERDSDETHTIQKHRLRTVVPVEFFGDNTLRLTPEIDFTEYAGDVRRIHGRVDARTRIGPVDASLTHSSRIFPNVEDSVLHTTRGSIKYQIIPDLSTNLSVQRAYCIYRTPRSTYAAETEWTGFDGVSLAPFVRGRFAATDQHWLGLKTELRLDRRTWTNVVLEYPLHHKNEDGMYIRASSSYSF